MALRIVSWNVENAARVAGPDARTPLATVARALGDPDVLCLQELRVRPRDGAEIEALHAALPGYACHAALADDPRNVTFRGGRMYGVATWTRARLRATSRGVPWDREGRVVVTEIAARRLAVINVYAVNGTAKGYWDHEHGAWSGDRHAFKRRVQERVGDEGRALRARGFELVIIGDWNVSRARIDVTPRLRTEEPHATVRRELNDVLMPSLDLVDPFRELHPDERAYTWFGRTRRGALDAARVDYALVSRSLLPRVVDAGIERDADRRFGSDHAPLWVVLRDRERRGPSRVG